MDTLEEIWYMFRNETLWHSPAIGKATTECDCFASSRKDLPLCRPETEGILELGDSVVSAISQEGKGGTALQADSGTALSTDRWTEGEIEEVAFGWPQAGRILHRLVDSEADCPANRKALWGSVWLGWNSETFGRRFGMELSKTGTSRSSTGRGSHCLLEASHMAGYKKTPENLGPIWFFSTKADSCSFPTCVELGLLAVKPPFCDTASNMIASPPSAVSAFRLKDSTWGFTWSIRPTISPESKSSFFCGICCGICADPWFCFGTEARFIDARSLRGSFNTVRASKFIASPPMRRNSTRRNLCGPRRNTICRTARTEICRNCTNIFDDPFDESVAPSGCCGLASTHPTSRGNRLRYVSII